MILIENIDKVISFSAIIISGLSYLNSKKILREQKQKEVLDLKQKLIDVSSDTSLVLENNLSYLTERLHTIEIFRDLEEKRLSDKEKQNLEQKIEAIKTGINKQNEYIDRNEKLFKSLLYKSPHEISYDDYTKELDFKKYLLSNFKILTSKYRFEFDLLNDIKN